MTNTSMNTIVVRDSKGALFLETGAIVRIEAVNNYSALYLADGRKLTVSKVLKQFDNLLNGHGFTRIHRSHLVNRSWVQLYNPVRGELEMKNKDRIQVSRRRKTATKKSLFNHVI